MHDNLSRNLTIEKYSAPLYIVDIFLQMLFISSLQGCEFVLFPSHSVWTTPGWSVGSWVRPALVAARANYSHFWHIRLKTN